MTTQNKLDTKMFKTTVTTKGNQVKVFFGLNHHARALDWAGVPKGLAA